MSQENIRVTFVEDDKWLRDNFVREISLAGGFVCAGAYATAEDAIACLPDNAPDVAVLDINLPGMSGIECLRLLKPLCPNTRFLILTAYDEGELIFHALQAGASGYLLQRTGAPELLAAIRQAYAGYSPMSRVIARQVVHYFNQKGAVATPAERLSPREREVLEQLANGHTYQKIADELALSIETVRMHVKQIYAKLEVHSRSAAVTKYLQRP